MLKQTYKTMNNFIQDLSNLAPFHIRAIKTEGEEISLLGEGWCHN